MLLPADGGALDVQVFVERAGEDGLRAVSVHARPASSPVGTASGQAAWVLHAHGRIAGGGPSIALEPQASATGEWPPRDALETDLSSAYERLAADGYTYGPAFRALRRMWRRGDELLAEVALPEQARTDDGFGVHPVLIDAALHAVLLASPQGSATRMPFSWSGVRIRPSASRVLRIRAVPSGERSWALSATDTAGAAVFEVDAVSFLPASGIHPPLLETAWTATALHAVPATDADTVVLGLPLPGLPGVPAVAGLVDVHAVFHARAPRTIVVGPEQSAGPSVSAEGRGREVPVALHAAAHRHVRLLQDFLAEERFAETTLVLCTLRATTPDPDPVAAAVSALWRSAAAEHPGRVVQVDLDGTAASDALLIVAVAAGEPRLALRGGLAHTPALAPVRDDALVPPPGPGSWKLALTGPAQLTTPERLALVPAPEHDAAPAAGQVRVRVRAAGLNFVDVITTVGLFPGDASLGREFAGVVTETGPEVLGLAPGDRVMGILRLSGSAIAPHVIADHRLVTRVPDTWTFAEAATVPIAFLTAYHGLVTLGGLAAGESVLLHAATGGVGMAALQIARHLGAEVFATAHPDKWPTLAALGVAPGRIASSRSAEFEHVFRAATAGRGVDVVLDALAGPLVDASLRLLAPEGRFLEMGKLDIRTRQQVDAIRPDARYRPFDILSVDADGIADAYRALMPLFDKGVLRPLPLTAWDVRDAKDALLTFRDARHTGKLVLTVPARPEPDGTVLITGGAGSLGAELARHLVRRHGTRHLLLAGRAPADDPRVRTLTGELAALGADVGYRQTDVSDAGQVAKLLASVPAEHPLTAVVHAAGALRDATVTSLDDERIDAVLAPKADGAWHLHEQTRDLDLAWFTLYSSVAGVLGLPGQANYAAANAFLDALAAHRAARGLPGRSLAWGLWEQPTGMSSHLTALDIGRMASAGLAPLPTHQGLALFDAATQRTEARLVATRRATPGTARPEVDGAGDGPDARLGSGGGSAPGGTQTLRDRLSQLPADRRADGAVDWIRRQAATVLRLADQDAVRLSRSFRDLGFDSLTSVELRNKLSAATGLRLPVTVVFEHPTPEALAELVVERLFPSAPEHLVAAPGPASDGAAEVADAPALPLDVAKAGAQELLRLIDAELDGTDTAHGEAGR
jgi:NADPH:quinone reductase-like Zn-dependent oxidoreductase/NAD(P)-dependent dehydrogenase (short-subunit alcohol dehydrogenase family)/acyl carrier protein